MKAYAETKFEVRAERSSLTYEWKNHGLRIRLPEQATASFHIKAVWSSRFELLEGTELVSPVYWVSYEGEVGGQVGVELQHCARVRAEGQQSGLSFAVCKLEKAEPPFRFELCEGQFSSRSTYGRMEVGISRMLVAMVRRVKEWGREQTTADPTFLAKVYYHQQQSRVTAHIMMVPQLELTVKVS